jgi:hypothetical protein
MNLNRAGELLPMKERLMNWVSLTLEASVYGDINKSLKRKAIVSAPIQKELLLSFCTFRKKC